MSREKMKNHLQKQQKEKIPYKEFQIRKNRKNNIINMKNKKRKNPRGVISIENFLLTYCGYIKEENLNKETKTNLYKYNKKENKLVKVKVVDTNVIRLTDDEAKVFGASHNDIPSNIIITTKEKTSREDVLKGKVLMVMDINKVIKYYENPLRNQTYEKRPKFNEPKTNNLPKPKAYKRVKK